MSERTQRIHYRIRLPPELQAMLEIAREKNFTTMTGEIVRRLQWSFKQELKQEYLTKRLLDLDPANRPETLDQLPQFR